MASSPRSGLGRLSSSTVRTPASAKVSECAHCASRQHLPNRIRPLTTQFRFEVIGPPPAARPNFPMSDVFELQKEASWQRMDRATAQRKSLLAAGFLPLPINDKAPQLYPNAFNTGILTRTTPAIDIDVYDANVVQEIRNLVLGMVGDSGHLMVRVGQAPKCAIPFQTDQPLAKISTPIFASPDGRKHHVEVLGDGQQVVVFGRHPDP